MHRRSSSARGLLAASLLFVVSFAGSCIPGAKNAPDTAFCDVLSEAIDLTSYLGSAYVGELSTGPNSTDDCGDGENGQVLFSFDAPEADTYSFSTSHAATDFDTVMHAFTDCARDDAAVSRCDDDGGSGIQSMITVELDAGQTLWVAVGGFSSSNGSFGLTVTQGEVEPVDSCIAFDRVEGVVVPPAGVAAGFRVIGCGGNPVPDLNDYDGDGDPDCVGCSLRVINNETGQDFNESSEGGSASGSGTNNAVVAYSVLVLDFSFSIFEAEAAQDVVNGALAYIDATLVNPAEPLDHQVALVAFGAPDELELISDFTSEPIQLQNALSAALAEGSRGTTDLYGAYIDAISRVNQAGTNDPNALVERFVVLMTDGTHEAGNTDQLRQQALSALSSTDATVFSIGIAGDYDAQALSELASYSNAFVSVEESDDLAGAFEDAAARALALARSNYVIGVCTPVALGNPSLTIEVTVGGSQGSVTLDYSTENLTGDFENCDASAVAGILGGSARQASR